MFAIRPSESGDATQRPDSYWVSLNYFNIYRIIVASVFLLATLFYARSLGLGSQNSLLFAWSSVTYWLVALLFYGALRRFRRRFNMQLSLQVMADVLALTLMMAASGGSRSGLAAMLLIVLAGAGLVGQGRLTLFYSALATVAVLLEQGYRVLNLGGDAADFAQTGILCIGFFATAISARLLARRVIANERLAQQRGVALANQLSISERVIRDMQDGLLVVDDAEKVRQFNPQAEALLGVHAPGQPELGSFSAVLVEQLRSLNKCEWKSARVMLVPGSGVMVRARFVRAGGSGDALIYLEDLGRIQAQAQQLKLAALGRLTASIAHEIRNPLSAISHAAELLREEQRVDKQERLSRIIQDNSQRIERLVHDVLELGRRDRAEPEGIRLARFVEGFLDEFVAHESADRSVFALEADADVVLFFDRAHLNQVLWNLLSNALRHSRRGPGAVRISARANPLARRTELHIIDDGAGIAGELQGRIFEPFFTTHNEGTGLGLYIARELCDANGAVLEWIDNQPGAHFRLSGRKQEWQDESNAGVRPQ